MSVPYQKHPWVSKEIIRRDYLNNIEDGIYDEQERAIAAEETLTTRIATEETRAKNKENTLQTNINTVSAELTTQTARIDTAFSDIAAEQTRAHTQEDFINDALGNEVTRAKGVEANCVKYSDIATVSKAGIVTVDGSTITINNGALSAVDTNFRGTMEQWNELTIVQRSRYLTADIY